MGVGMTERSGARARLIQVPRRTINLDDATPAAPEEPGNADVQAAALLSRQMPVDEMLRPDFQAGRLIQPPYDLEALTKMPEESPLLMQCVAAMQVNIESFGHDFAYIGPKDGEESKDALAEKDRLETFFKTLNDRESFISIRRKLRADIEYTGGGYLEVLRDLSGQPALVEHMPAYSMRLSPIDKQVTFVKTQVVGVNGQVMTRTVPKRFRRFVQCVNGQKVWFKEFGDPRPILSKTGELPGEGQEWGPEDLATEVLHFTIYSPRYVGGMPRFIGNLPSIRGQRYAEIVDVTMFSRFGIPPTIVTVSGGQLSDDSFEEVKQYFQRAAGGLDKYWDVLVIESEPYKTGVVDTKEAGMKIDIKSLQEARPSDAQFLQYMDYCAKNVRSAFRLPPIFVGLSEDYNFASAQASLVTAEEQVFSVERKQFDEVINLQLLRALGARFWEFYSKGPEIADVNTFTTAITAFNAVGAMTPNQAIMLANELLGTTMDPIEQEWGNFPFPIVESMASSGRLAGLEDITAEGMDPLQLLADQFAQAGGPGDTTDNSGDGPAQKVQKMFRRVARDMRQVSAKNRTKRRRSIDLPDA